MSSKDSNEDAVIDACCLVNICSTRNPSRIFAHTGMKWYVPAAVKAESLYRYKPDADGNLVREPIPIQELADSGCLALYTPAVDEELELYVQLAAVLDDGEAMALAVAKYRRWWFASDDRKARKIATGLSVKLLGTPEILQRWVASFHPDDGEVAAVLLDIQSLARFVPATSSTAYAWWMRHLRGNAK